MEKRFGSIKVCIERAWDSAVLERFLLPAIAYQTTTHWGEKAIGHAQMGHSLVISFWNWSLRIKYIVYDWPLADEADPPDAASVKARWG